ncbi:MAG TPA: UDP-N-acetylglucosamine--N-acetylmuramyl-(pentapeptide) pyrophosphoryl-undecaprenol N-acetylglucosamine transferase [Phycisphaerales bacterium]|nr:UDP-N-acetylglucosamine--N-acetylmuramyl-(pentapeptide) pyrophosphoryl-undecaprenol N-acetylglucosamine transferase [Phycisphaerales bacterium]
MSGPDSNTLSATARRPLLVFVGGGSGGHIFPALAIDEEVTRLCGSAGPPHSLFVVSDRAIDEKIMSPTGLRFERSPARPLIARPMGLVRFARGWSAAKKQARAILTGREWSARSGVHVVAMGGFVAGPFVSAATSLGASVTMVNLDAIPGKANAYIARRADRIFTAARVPAEHRAGREWNEVPPIVRGAARVSRPRAECRAALSLDPSRPVLMVTGGSQGLRSLNNFVGAFGASPAGQRTLREHRWQVLHQTGRNLDDAPRAAYQAAGIDATVVPFTDQMGLWWGAADVAVCTAGAGNIAEIWMNTVPALLLPYPHHKDEHQKYNALPLTEAGGALLGKDWIDPQRNLAHNAGLLESLLAEEPRRAALRANLEKLGPADGAARIARALLDG